MSDGSVGLGRSGEIESGRRQLGMSLHDVWVGYFAVGGNGSVAEIEAWLSGVADLPAREHDMLAQAVNDRFTDRGLDHPVPYSDAF